jgi:hypothetical protein
VLAVPQMALRRGSFCRTASPEEIFRFARILGVGERDTDRGLIQPVTKTDYRLLQTLQLMANRKLAEISAEA